MHLLRVCVCIKLCASALVVGSRRAAPPSLMEVAGDSEVQLEAHILTPLSGICWSWSGGDGVELAEDSFPEDIPDDWFEESATPGGPSSGATS